MTKNTCKIKKDMPGEDKVQAGTLHPDNVVCKGVIEKNMSSKNNNFSNTGREM